MPRKAGCVSTKEQHWRGVISAWHASGLNGAEFCRRHGHMYSHFQDWRRIIRKRDAAPATEQLVVADSKSRRGEHSYRVTNPRRHVADFVQASITDSALVVPAASNDSMVEVILPCGAILRITTACPPQFLSSIVTALENR